VAPAHALALHAGLGTSAGNFPGRGPFYVGGFVDLPDLRHRSQSAHSGRSRAARLSAGHHRGRSSALFNAEYRFPIINIDRGFSTFPVFFQRLSGTLFTDYGAAFDDASTAKFKTGVGGELWLDCPCSPTF